MTENEDSPSRKQDNQVYSRRSMLRMFVGLEGTRGRIPFKKTLNQSIICTSGIIGATVAFESLGVKTGNSFADKKLGTDINWKTFGIAVGLMPLREEGIFRVIPSILLSRFRDTLWPVGVIDAAIFAGSHNIQIDENGKDYLATKRVPLQQFALGMFFWKLARERGYLHAILAHVTNNFVSLSPVFIDQTLSDKKKRS